MRQGGYEGSRLPPYYFLVALPTTPRGRARGAREEQREPGMRKLSATFAIAASLIALAIPAAAQSPLPAPSERQRMIVLSDIEADPDDTQSFVRLFLYANQIDLEGLVATTSIHMKTQVHPESIRRIIQAYGKVQSNLARHEAGFPMPDRLGALARAGA